MNNFTIYTVACVTSMVIIIGISTATISGNSAADEMPEALAKTGSEYLQTISPIMVSDAASSIFIGTVVSHETANIYPRRDGIVEDIFVDIGDAVEKNQVVALLLPKGVEGQGAADIAGKNALKLRAESDYLNAQSVAQQTILKTAQDIEEIRTSLAIAQSEQASLVRKIAQEESNVSQMQDQAFVAAQKARQAIERILTGTNTRTGVDIYEDDIVRKLGIISPESRHHVVTPFNALNDLEEAYSLSDDMTKETLIYALLEKVLSTLNITHSLLSNTPPQPIYQPGRDITRDPVEMIGEVLTLQNDVLKAKERLEDAIFNYETLVASEPELLLQIDNARSNKVKTTMSRLETSEKNLDLVKQQQQQKVESMQKAVDIADAMLRSESAASGHKQIRSPFAGTVSKRFIEVGQIVMPSASAFELVDVPTSLSKKAKAEIQFGLPEHLMSTLNTGDQISFFLPENDRDIYIATVTRKSPQVDSSTHTITIQAKIDDELSLPHRTSVRIRLADESIPLFRVPSQSVKREDDSNFIWAKNPETGEPEKIIVSVQSEDGEFAEITGDISTDLQIILDPPDLFVIESDEEI